MSGQPVMEGASGFALVPMRSTEYAEGMRRVFTWLERLRRAFEQPVSSPRPAYQSTPSRPSFSPGYGEPFGCPECGSENLEGGGSSNDYAVMWRCSCVDCGYTETSDGFRGR